MELNKERTQEILAHCEARGVEYISGYANHSSRVVVKCKVCGYQFERSFISISTASGNACPKCRKAKKEEAKSITKDEARNKAREAREAAHKSIKCRNAQIVELRNQGKSLMDIATQFNMSESAIGHICKDAGCGRMNFKSQAKADAKEKRDAQIVELRKQGESEADIGKLVGLSAGGVGRICRDRGFGGTISQKKASTTTEEGKARLRELYIMPDDKIKERCNAVGVEYVSGYTGCGSMVMVRCKTCGGEFERSFVTIRAGKRTTCPHCVNIKKQERAEHIAREREAERQRKQIQRESARQEKELLRLQQVECKECGRIFTSDNSHHVFCSRECRKRNDNRKTDWRFEKFGTEVIDKNISVAKLYARDKGKCWICGQQCDINDYKEVNGNIICGNKYPSVDHVIPVSKGGAHSWLNVKLAHRICNTVKSNSI